MASKIDIVSNALILIGDAPINSLTGNSRAQQVSSNLYDSIKENELSKHRWSFARRKIQLSLTTSTPIDSEYGSIYQLPSDMITLIKINPNVDYEVYGDLLYTNLSQALYCDYIRNVTESEFTPAFTKMLEYALAMDFAASIRDSASAQQTLSVQYVNAARMARYADSQQHPQRAIVSRPFVDVRF